MLLKSWAMPPARVPSDSIFWAWRSWRSSDSRSVMSVVITTTFATWPCSSTIGLADRLRVRPAVFFLVTWALRPVLKAAMAGQSAQGPGPGPERNSVISS